MEKAGFWKLCAAYLIDFVFISIAGLILGAILGGIIGALLALLGKPEAVIARAAFLVGAGVGYLLNIVYFAIFESVMGASLGKKWLGIRVSKA